MCRRRGASESISEFIAVYKASLAAFVEVVQSYYDEETRKTQWEKPDGNGRREDEHGIGCPRWRHRTLGGVRPGRS